MAEVVNYSYPRKISEIPYASFLAIQKYSYDEAMKSAAQSQKDALGAVSNSGLVKGMADSLANGANWIYGNGTNSMAFANDKDSAIDKTRTKLLNKKWSKIGMLEGLANDVGLSSSYIDTMNEVNAMTDDQILDEKFEGRFKNGKREQISLRDTLKRKKEVAQFRAEGYKESHCNLPLPNEFQYNYGANWNNTFRLGTMALAAEDPARAAAILGVGGVVGGSVGALKTFLSGTGKGKMASGIASGTLAGMKKASDPFNVNSAITNPRNIAGLAGMAPNENAVQFFQKMEFRQFELNFEFASRDDKESKVIQDILKWFKLGMHPTSMDPLGSGSGVLLGFPDVFVLKPMFVPVVKGEAETPIPHKMMPKTKLCALVGLTVNSTPFGALTTIHDGTIPLITATLRFNELTALTRADFAEDGATL